MPSPEKRTEAFRRNESLEVFLSRLNGDLWASEERLLAQCDSNQMAYPLVLVMGPLRSGTTLFLQWLASTGFVAYPTNLLSRFYGAPILGSKIQLLLTDPRFSFRDELGEFIQQAEYRSENGKTKGVLAPNEFWYFWRRFLADPSRDVWTDDELRRTFDAQTMKAELAGVMDVFQKPFAAKGMLFNYNIPYLDSVIENALFIQIKRDPLANAASVLEARKRQLGSEDAWYSFKIPEYETLKAMDPIHQAAGQVHCIDRAVSAGLETVANARKMVVEYEAFCQSPERTFHELTRKLGFSDLAYEGPTSFSVTRKQSGADAKLIARALDYFKHRT